MARNKIKNGASKLPSIKEAISDNHKAKGSVYYLLSEHSAQTANRSYSIPFHNPKISSARHEVFAFFAERLRELLKANALTNHDKSEKKKYYLRIDLVVDNGRKMSRYPIESYNQPYPVYGRTTEKRILNSKGYYI